MLTLFCLSRTSFQDAFEIDRNDEDGPQAGCCKIPQPTIWQLFMIMIIKLFLILFAYFHPQFAYCLQSNCKQCSNDGVDHRKAKQQSHLYSFFHFIDVNSIPPIYSFTILGHIVTETDFANSVNVHNAGFTLIDWREQICGQINSKPFMIDYILDACSLKKYSQNLQVKILQIQITIVFVLKVINI
jgi:hypothetical protein